MARRNKNPDLIGLDAIRAAVAELEAELAAGRIRGEEATKRINACRRAVTPRDLWKASGHRAGSRRRSDWREIRSTAFNLGGLLLMLVVGVWLVTWTLAQLHGSAP
jgi:hypothetical protein